MIMPLEALLLGLSTGSYCVLNCAPLTLPFLFAEGSGPKRNAGLVGLFMTGRLAGYLIVGLILGFSGLVLLKYVNPWLEYWLSTIGFGIAGFILLLQGLGYTEKFKAFCAVFHAKAIKRNALILGLVSGLSLCPPFVTAAARVLTQASSGSAEGTLLGGVYFLCFFMGTTVFFLPLLGVPLFKKWKEQLAGIARICMVLMGAYFFFLQFLFELVKQGVSRV
jgi:hypothetical protein